ncbi:MAG: hypothetical protein AB8F26_10400, partial [Phycisphaerales bacterium]
MSDHITLTIAPSEYAHLLDLIDSRIRSERARASAYRRIEDLSNEMVAVDARNRLAALRESLVAGIQRGASDDCLHAVWD